MTIHYIQVWKKCIVYLMPEMPGDAEVQALAEFLAGGTGQMIKSFKASGREDVGKNICYTSGFMRLAAMLTKALPLSLLLSIVMQANKKYGTV